MKEYKGYYIKAAKDLPAHYVVVTVGKGGKIPDILSGLFTSTGIAMFAIDKYLTAKQEKASKDGKEFAKSGD